ncbi:MAG: hypothetical protein OIF38_03555 [Cellvibrionaceae bacterium]|nr:hypothetical protein [Cellvibrionaceae bacterium]
MRNRDLTAGNILANNTLLTQTSILGRCFFSGAVIKAYLSPGYFLICLSAFLTCPIQAIIASKDSLSGIFSPAINRQIVERTRQLGLDQMIKHGEGRHVTSAISFLITGH